MYKAAKRTVSVWGKRTVVGGAKPYTIINVKPYTIIVCEGKLLCGGERQLPLVFDTKCLARLFAASHCLDSCNFIEMELEELARKCRDRKVKFDSFYLIDDKSQLDVD